MGDGPYKDCTVSSKQLKIDNSHINITFKNAQMNTQLYYRICEQSLRIAQES